MAARPGGFDAELNWWLNESQSIMGERGVPLILSEAGKCSGTKGVFRNYQEPYSDRVLGFGLLKDQGLIARANRCRKAWQLLSTPHRNTAMARYLFEVDESQKGLHGAVGELAGVVVLIASRRERPDEELALVAGTQNWQAYAKALRKKTGILAQAVEACRIMHLAWIDCRVEVDRANRR